MWAQQAFKEPNKPFSSYINGLGQFDTKTSNPRVYKTIPKSEFQKKNQVENKGGNEHMAAFSQPPKIMKLEPVRPKIYGFNPTFSLVTQLDTLGNPLESDLSQSMPALMGKDISAPKLRPKDTMKSFNKHIDRTPSNKYEEWMQQLEAFHNLKSLQDEQKIDNFNQRYKDRIFEILAKRENTIMEMQKQVEKLKGGEIGSPNRHEEALLNKIGFLEKKLEERMYQSQAEAPTQRIEQKLGYVMDMMMYNMNNLQTMMNSVAHMQRAQVIAAKRQNNMLKQLPFLKGYEDRYDEDPLDFMRQSYFKSKKRQDSKQKTPNPKKQIAPSSTQTQSNLKRSARLNSIIQSQRKQKLQQKNRAERQSSSNNSEGSSDDETSEDPRVASQQKPAPRLNLAQAMNRNQVSSSDRTSASSSTLHAQNQQRKPSESENRPRQQNMTHQPKMGSNKNQSVQSSQKISKMASRNYSVNSPNLSRSPGVQNQPNLRGDQQSNTYGESEEPTGQIQSYAAIQNGKNVTPLQQWNMQTEGSSNRLINQAPPQQIKLSSQNKSGGQSPTMQNQNYVFEDY